METLSVLRILVRHRLLVLLGALGALAAGVAATGASGVGPFDGATLHSWSATVEVQVDTPRPLVADAMASAATIQTQTILLADYLTSDATRAEIARDAGLDPAALAVSPAAIDTPIRQSPLVVRAGEAALVPMTTYRVTPTTAELSPLMGFVATGPDRAVTEALARATVTAARSTAGASAAGATHRLAVKELGPVRLAEHSSGGVQLPLGIALGLFLFVGWCVTVVLASGIARVWRAPRAPAAA